MYRQQKRSPKRLSYHGISTSHLWSLSSILLAHLASLPSLGSCSNYTLVENVYLHFGHSILFVNVVALRY